MAHTDYKCCTVHVIDELLHDRACMNEFATLLPDWFVQLLMSHCLLSDLGPVPVQEWAIPGMGMFCEAYFIFSIGELFNRMLYPL